MSYFQADSEKTGSPGQGRRGRKPAVPDRTGRIIFQQDGFRGAIRGENDCGGGRRPSGHDRGTIVARSKASSGTSIAGCRLLRSNSTRRSNALDRI